jgi:hypothetical protein
MKMDFETIWKVFLSFVGLTLLSIAVREIFEIGGWAYLALPGFEKLFQNAIIALVGVVYSIASCLIARKWKII